MVKKKKIEYIFAVGRRKESVARVRLYKGRGENVVNQKKAGEYFRNLKDAAWLVPFKLTQTEGKYWVSVKVEGGGIAGQAGAVTLGIARALSEADREKFRPILKKNKLLTRDARVRERRKVGTGGKARRKKQSPKR